MGLQPSTMFHSLRTEDSAEEVLEEEEAIPVQGVQLGPLLGRGSYGRVYLGMWENKEVAVKV